MICECSRCGKDDSSFWYSVAIGDEYVGELCDKCMRLFWEFLKEGTEE